MSGWLFCFSSCEVSFLTSSHEASVHILDFFHSTSYFHSHQELASIARRSWKGTGLDDGRMDGWKWSACINHRCGLLIFFRSAGILQYRLDFLVVVGVAWIR